MVVLPPLVLANETKRLPVTPRIVLRSFLHLTIRIDAFVQARYFSCVSDCGAIIINERNREPTTGNQSFPLQVPTPNLCRLSTSLNFELHLLFLAGNVVVWASCFMSFGYWLGYMRPNSNTLKTETLTTNAQAI